VVDAATLFAQTRSAIASVAYPPRISYEIVVSGFDGSVPRADHYRALVRTQTGDVRVEAESDEEAANPVPPPHGVNTSLTATICIARGGCATHSEPAGRTPGSPDLLGVPVLSPAYDFGIVTPYRASRRAETEPTTLPVIASVVSSRRDYDISFLGMESIGNDMTDHLHFVPLHEPHRYRLRDLWINPTTHLPERAIVAGNFTVAPMTDVPWSIDFGSTANAWYISSETAMSTLYLSHQHVVRDAAISFEQIQPFDGIYGPALRPGVSPTTLVEP
jgi:hypothetical protein